MSDESTNSGFFSGLFEEKWKRDVTVFLSGQTVSLFGSLLVQYAISWYVVLRTQSGIMMTIAVICGFLPTFFLSPFAGVWADRYNRKTLIILADTGIALATLALGVAPVFWLYLVFVWLIGLAMPLFNTPFTVLLQQKIQEGYLGRVFGLFGMLSSSMMPLGMVVFGPVADIVAIEWLLIGSGAVLFVEALFLFGNKAVVEAGEPLVES